MLRSMAILLSLAVAGCSGEIHKHVSVDDGSGVSVDARQRLVLVTKNGGEDGDQQVVCAEPSPDAITVAAATASFDATSPNGTQAEGSLARSETAAFIGMRTQTVQILRDSLFRACEAYMNGAISSTEYNIIIANSGRIATNLIAIDGLTFTQAAPALAIAATAKSGGSDPILDSAGHVIDPTTYAAANAEVAKHVSAIVKMEHEKETRVAVCLMILADPESTQSCTARLP